MGKKRPPAPASEPAAVAYSYIRFSTPEQRGGDSLRRQTAAAVEWCARTGAQLDTSLTFHDLGTSAYMGEHRSNPDRYALAAFLRAVDEGKVRPGSFLIIESLDRLTREHVRAGLMLLLGLIEKGVRIVQLSPSEIIFDRNADEMGLMLAIVELSRGHRESKRKSDVLGKVWGAKKDSARAGELYLGIQFTSALPAWVKVEGGERRNGKLYGGTLVLDEERAKVVRRVYQLATDGHGLGAITKRLNAEGVPVIGRAKFWARSYVFKLLNSRAAMGEYQPHKGHSARDRKPDGAPIPGYFPAAVTEDEWNAARLAAAGRKNKTGRPGKWLGIFSGLLHDARDGGALHYIHKGAKSAGRMLVPYRAASGVDGSRFLSFPADVFEKAVLSKLREIDPRDVLPRGDGGADKVAALAGREVELAGRVERIKAAMLAGGEVESVVDVLRKLDADLTAVRAELSRARMEAASPLSEAWGEMRPLVDMLEAAPDPDEARTRLRAAVRRVVSEVWCLFVGEGGRVLARNRLAAVQLWFKGGGCRDYLIVYRKAVGGSVVSPGGWRARSLPASRANGGADLRVRAHAARLEKVLAGLDVAGLKLDDAPAD